MAVKRPKGRPEPLQNLLAKSLEGSALGERLKDLEVWRQWEAVVGSAIARRTRPLRLTSGVLTVLVGSAPWMQQLSFMKADLRERLNQRLGGERIREIVLKSGRVDDDAPAAGGEEIVSRALTSEQEAWIDQQVGTLEDELLREQFRQLMRRHYRTVR